MIGGEDDRSVLKCVLWEEMSTGAMVNEGCVCTKLLERLNPLRYEYRWKDDESAFEEVGQDESDDHDSFAQSHFITYESTSSGSDRVR